MGLSPEFMIRKINEKLEEVSTYFGTKSEEYNHLLTAIHGAHKKVPYKHPLSGAVHHIIIPLDDVNFTGTNIYGDEVLEYSIEGYRQLEEDYGKSARTALKMAYEAIKYTPTEFQLAQAYKNEVGSIRSMKEMAEKRDLIRASATKYKEITDKFTQNFIYLSENQDSSLFGQLTDESLKDEIIARMKAPRGNKRQWTKEWRSIEHLIVNALSDQFKKQKEMEAEKSAEMDTQEEYTQKAAVSKIKASRKRRK